MSAIEEMAKAAWKATAPQPVKDEWWDTQCQENKDRAYKMADDFLAALISHLKAGAPEMVEAFMAKMDGEEADVIILDHVVKGLIAVFEKAKEG